MRDIKSIALKVSSVWYTQFKVTVMLLYCLQIASGLFFS